MGLFDADHWQEIWAALTKNRFRTSLTAFGVFWGIFMLMVMIGSGTGLENGVSRDFVGSATNSFFVWTQSTSKPYRGLPAGRRFEMRNADIDAIRMAVPEAAVIAARNQLGGYRGGNNVTRGNKAGAFSVMGDYPEIRLIDPIRVKAGRFLNHFDIEQRRKVAVIGTRVAEVLFADGSEQVGGSIEINSVYFKVIGVFGSRKGGEDAEDEAQKIFIPFTTFQTAFNYGDVVGWFAITARDGVPASTVEERVLTVLRSRHRVAPADERAIGHWNTEKEYNQILGLFLGIRTLVWIVGIGTLAAGVIGVSNIMLVIVKERTREIGIRRAIGATPGSIVSQIVFEAILLTSIAGALGLMAGVFTMEGVASAVAASGSEMFLSPGVSLSSALRALAVLISAGVVAGMIPAQRAISISPVQALRSE